MKSLSWRPNTMALKNWRLISLSGVLLALALRLFFTPMMPTQFDVYIEDKIHLIRADEPLVIHLMHPDARHPYLDKDAIVNVRLISDEVGLTLTLTSSTTEILMNQSALTTMVFHHPWVSSEVSLKLESPTLILTMINGSTLSFELPFMGIFPEKEGVSLIQLHQLYGLYADDTLGLQGLFMRVHNPTDRGLCFYRINLGLTNDIPFENLFITPQRFKAHQRFADYDKTPFHGCIAPFESLNILVESPSDSVVESVVLTLDFEQHRFYLEPIRLVRNIPFHHDIKTLRGVIDDSD